MFNGLGSLLTHSGARMDCHSALASQYAHAACSYASALRAEMLMSLLRKEREMGITPDPAVDAYLKVRLLASCKWVSKQMTANGCRGF